MMDFDATLVAQMLNFLVLFLVLNAILFRPVYRALEERRRYLQEGQQNLNASLARIQEMQRRYQQMIDGARQQAQSRIDRTLQEAERQRQEEIRQVLDEGRRRLEAALETLRREKDALLGQLGTEISFLAERISQKVLAPVHTNLHPSGLPLLSPEPAGEP